MRPLAFFLSLRNCVGLLGGLCLLAGCAALQGSVSNEVDVAAHFLPTTRSVASFDSLQHVSVVSNDDGRLKLESDRAFGDLWVDWSARHRQTQGPELYETRRFSSFATLWGREFRLASLNRRTPLDAYPPDQARATIHQEVDSLHQDAIRIDVYLYVPERVSEAFQYTSIRHMGARVFLRINDGTQDYSAKRIETSIVRYTTRSGEGVFYRRNTLIFARQPEDNIDILADAQRLTLYVRSVSFPRARLQFSWEQDVSGG